MTKSFFSTFIRSSILLFLIIFIYSCKKLSTDNDVPSYLSIKTVALESNNSLYGENTHNISDVWIYVDDVLIGAFELPAKIPIIKEGTCKLSITAGIKINGIYSTRAAYSFYNPYIVNVELIKNKIIEITPTFTYDSNASYEWLENFENNGISFESVSESDTFSIIKSSSNVCSGLYSGEIILNDENPICKIYNFKNIEMPRLNSHVFLEMDFFSPLEIEVGVITNESNQSIEHSVFILNPTTFWKKVYINLTPVITRENTADSYRVYLKAVKSSNISQQSVYIDNIKLIQYR
ncbi:MAG: hypothetical protein A2X12_03650 [Bacteroidetes bacterium GWE2_29_8]|nr:MAG: hypothetical protein A2X12_03650 [Bacteroidetes bacterium GWE2_29_8]